ncbi:MAG: hypothetical protein U0744_15765 [Gemmataceae bacterium]
MRGTVDEQPPLFHTFCVEAASGPTTRCGTSSVAPTASSPG